MRGPHHCPGRGASAPNSEILRRLLQLRQNASILEQGCAGFSPGSANRCDQFMRHPGRTSSPLRPSLSFRYTQVSARQNRRGRQRGFVHLRQNSSLTEISTQPFWIRALRNSVSQGELSSRSRISHLIQEAQERVI